MPRVVDQCGERESGGAHSEFLPNSIAGLKYGGRSLDLRGRASFEQPFAKDAAITLPGDDRDRIALVELKTGRTHNDPSIQIRVGTMIRMEKSATFTRGKQRR
jgi:hypothetical protein